MLPMGVSIHTVYFQVSFNNSDLMSERVKTPNRGTVGIVSSCHTWRLGQMFRWMGCVGMGQGQASRVCEWRMFGAQAVYWRGVVSLQKLLIDVPGVTAGVWFPFREFLVNKASAPPETGGINSLARWTILHRLRNRIQLLLPMHPAAIFRRASVGKQHALPPSSGQQPPLPPHGSSMSGQLTNSASWLASTCFACTASVLSSTRSASTSSATSPKEGRGVGAFLGHGQGQCGPHHRPYTPLL